MPHIQPRVMTKASRANLDDVLALIEKAGVNILGIGGSDHEFDGEVALLVLEEDVPTLGRVLAEYSPRFLTDVDGLHLDYAENVPGGLRAAVSRARRDHPTGVIKDITVGVDRYPFVVDDDGMVIRKPDGTPDDHAQGERIEAYPVQVYFLVPQERDENGVATT